MAAAVIFASLGAAATRTLGPAACVAAVVEHERPGACYAVHLKLLAMAR